MLVEHIAMCSHNTSMNHRTSEGHHDNFKQCKAAPVAASLAAHRVPPRVLAVASRLHVNRLLPAQASQTELGEHILHCQQFTVQYAQSGRLCSMMAVM